MDTVAGVVAVHHEVEVVAMIVMMIIVESLDAA